MTTRLTLELILNGGRVTRFHTHAFLKAETNAEHQYLVTWLCWWILGRDRCSATLLLAALSHDLPEHETGDMPAPIKRSTHMKSEMGILEAEVLERSGMPDFSAELSEAELSVLKFADCAAGYLKCAYEAKLGNRHLDKVLGTYYTYLTALTDASTDCSEEGYLRTRFTDLMEVLENAGE